MNTQHNGVMYKFYPSLIDKFQKYLDTTPENFFYQDEEGGWHINYNESTEEYHFSPEEVDELAKKSLIDAINRVPYSSAAASKGTAFNDIVDAFIHKNRPDAERTTMRGDKDNNIIYVTCDGIDFMFDWKFVESVADYFKDSVSQVLVTAPIDTDYGIVELYGYIDELRYDKVYDIKTTSRPYNLGDYEKYWQRHIYPYCLIKSGQMTYIESFEFTCYVLNGGGPRNPIISGTQYKEVYNHNQERSTMEIRRICERFIEFLEDNKEQITDKKVFAYRY